MWRCGCVKTVLQRCKSVGFFFFIIFSLLLTYDGEIYLLTLECLTIVPPPPPIINFSKNFQPPALIPTPPDY